MIPKKRIILTVLVSLLIIAGGCSKSGSNRQDSNSAPVHLTSQTFKEKVFNYEKNKEWKYEGDIPCIVDFYADWCAPCKKVAPILEDLSKEYSGKINVYKVNVDSENELASAFGIQSIPALLFVPASGQPQMVAGALPKEGFVKAINEVLLK